MGTSAGFGDGLSVEVTLDGDVGRLELVGALTGDAASEVLPAAITETLESGAKAVQLGFGGVAFIDPSGLALLLRVQERLRLPEVPLQLAGLSAAVAEVLAVTSMTSAFEIVDGPPEAASPSR